MNLFVFLLFMVSFYEGRAIRYSDQENEDLQKICGIKSTKSTWPPERYIRKILNGTAIPRKESPWSVMLVTKANNGVCSGTIISPRHILTAAHCFIRDQHRVRCDRGNEVWTGCANCTSILTYEHVYINSRATKVVVLRNCGNKDWMEEDSALLELEDDIPFTDDLKPVCVPKDRRFEAIGKQLQLNGFSNNKQRNYKLRTGYTQISEMYGAGKFIATDKRKIQGAWKGDSGGNGLINVNGKHFIVGIINGGRFVYDTLLTSVGRHAEEICYYTGICA